MKPRLIAQKLLQQRHNNKVSVLIGPRQVGKTTLLKFLHQKLGGLFLDVDVFSQFERISTYEQFLNTLKLEGYQEKQKEKFYVFLDEFQRYSDLSKVIKNIYDHHPNVKIFATGSSSLNIKNRLQESLAGRKIITHLYPLNFREFLIFKDQQALIPKLEQLSKIKSNNFLELIPNLKKYLEEFLIFGGYPEVVLAKTKIGKQEILESIFDLYVKKELVDYLKIEKIQQAKVLIEQIAVNHGAIANYATYGQRAGLDAKTVKNYLDILQETFLIKILKPYFSNKNKELTKAPKLYFLDNGVRNYFVNNFEALRLRNDAGALFEGFYLAELLKRGEPGDHLKYYRTKSQSEIDIIVDRISQVIPIEIKYQQNLNQPGFSALQTFMNNYNLEEGYVVNVARVGQGLNRIKMIDFFNEYF